MGKTIVFDSDDFALNEERNPMRYLLKIKERFPNFKITLFSIPFYNNQSQLAYFKFIHEAYGDWIQMAIHGKTHDTNFECSKWTYHEAYTHLSWMKQKPFFVPGFKAPGWQISRETYNVCNDLGIWVMDHDYSEYTEPGVRNVERRPKTLSVFESRDPRLLHTHTWNCVDNGIPQLYDKWVVNGFPFTEEDTFKFVDEVINDR